MKKVVCVITWITIMLAVLITFTALNVVFADQGKIEPKTFVVENPNTPDTWVPFGSVHLQQLRRSRFNRKDPNYYWLFDQCPCCYPELWVDGWVCPVGKPLPELPTQQNIPEPGAFLLTGTGLLIMYLKRKRDE